MDGNITEEKLNKLKEIIPEAFTENKDRLGKVENHSNLVPLDSNVEY